MKKSLIIFASVFLVGCGNEFTCTKEIEEEEYKTQEKLVFELDNNKKITRGTVSYIMSFEDEKSAKQYMNLFKSLGNDLEIELDDNVIKLSSTNDYTSLNEYKDTLKAKLEKDGYKCK